MAIRSRRRTQPAGDLAALTDEELAHLKDASGRLFDFRKPPLPGQAPDPDWLAWGREMRRRDLDFCAWGSFATEEERESRWRQRWEGC